MAGVAEIAQELEHYLAPNEAARRARMIVDDMAAIQFPLMVSREVPPAQWLALGVRPQAEYTLPASSFSVDAEDSNRGMAGSALTRGNLLRLSHAVEMGRWWFPSQWPGEFADGLGGTMHLDAVNELWWLTQ